MSANQPPSQIGNQPVHVYNVNSPGRVDVGLMSTPKGVLAIAALHIVGVNPGQAGFSQYMDGGQWARQVAVVLPDANGNFDFTNLNWAQRGDITETVQFTAPDLWVLCSLDTFSEHGHKIPDYAKYADKTHSCVDVGFTSK